jgi:YD repeat-containing protein
MTPNHLPTGVPAILLEYGFDAMRRLQRVIKYKFNPLTGAWSPDYDIVSNATWGARGELASLSYLGYTQTRSYNELGQLTEINSQGSTVTKFHEQYSFSPTANNGQITSSTDFSVVSTGEQVTYLYDELNRLTKADSAGGWGLSFGYDGFGNKTSQAPLPGKTGPTFTPTVDTATNRVTGTGITYDANGNLTAQGGATYAYDVENRVTSQSGFYYYGLDNSRVFDGSAWVFRAPDGRVIGRYTVSGNNGIATLNFTTQQTNIYFGGMLVGEGGPTAGTTGGGGRSRPW